MSPFSSATLLLTALLAITPAASAQHDCTGQTQLEDYLEFLHRAQAGQYDASQLPPLTLPIVVEIEIHSMNTVGSSIQPLAPSHPGNWTDQLNDEYEPYGIHFALRHVTDDTFSFNSPMSNPRTFDDVFAILNRYSSTDVIHVYFVDSMSINGVFYGGFATYSFCSRGQGVVVVKGSSPDGAFLGYGGTLSSIGTFAHEMGHFLDLIHPGEEWEDPPGVGSVNYAADCPDYSNCQTAGDFVCDTPAQPDPFAYSQPLYFPYPNCDYINGPNQAFTVGDDCPGLPYYPTASERHLAARNFMAVAPPECRTQQPGYGFFTAGQGSRMLAALINFRTPLYDPCVIGNPNLFECGGPSATTGAKSGSCAAVAKLSHFSGVGLAVGSPGVGRVHMFRGSTAATLDHDFTIVGQPTDRFGHSVTFDGDIVLVGAPDYQLSGFASNGLVTVRRRTAASCGNPFACAYEFAQSLFPPNDSRVNDFGVAVDSYADWAVVSTNDRAKPITHPQIDSVYVYRRNRTSAAPNQWTWSLYAELHPPSNGGTAPLYFGSDVAISGQHIVVGAWGAQNPAQGMALTGLAYVYSLDSATQTWSAPVTLPVEASARRFGWDVDIWGDTIIVGAPDNGPSTAPGRAYLYQKQGTAWVRTTTIVDPDAGGLFGASVSIAQNSALIGDPGVLSDIGRVYELGRAPFRDWDVLRVFDAPEQQAGQRFGSAVASSPDICVVGSDRLDRGASPALAVDSGGAYAFTHAAPPTGMTMTADRSTISLPAGDTVTMTIDCGVAAAGRFFAVVGSSTSSGPGSDYSTLTVPPLDSQEHIAFHSVLNLDTYSNFAMNPNNGIVGPVTGTLDSQGRATVQFVWPPNYLHALITSPTTFRHTVALGLDLHYESAPAVFVLQP